MAILDTNRMTAAAGGRAPVRTRAIFGAGEDLIDVPFLSSSELEAILDDPRRSPSAAYGTAAWDA